MIVLIPHMAGGADPLLERRESHGRASPSPSSSGDDVEQGAITPRKSSRQIPPLLPVSSNSDLAIHAAEIRMAVIEKRNSIPLARRALAQNATTNNTAGDEVTPDKRDNANASGSRPRSRKRKGNGTFLDWVAVGNVQSDGVADSPGSGAGGSVRGMVTGVGNTVKENWSKMVRARRVMPGCCATSCLLHPLLAERCAATTRGCSCFRAILDKESGNLSASCPPRRKVVSTGTMLPNEGG